MINIAIVDSDKELNSILFSRLKSAEVNPVEQFYSAKEFIDALPQLKSQILLIDITLPCYDLIDFISTTKKQKPGIKIIIMSAWVQHDLIYKAICAGVSGYVNKFGDKNYFINAILEIGNGQARLSLPIAQLIQSNISHHAVTTMELQMIKLFASGFSCNQIASALLQTADAICQQVTSVYHKLYRESSA